MYVYFIIVIYLKYDKCFKLKYFASLSSTKVEFCVVFLEITYIYIYIYLNENI